MRGIFLLCVFMLGGCVSHASRTAQTLQDREPYRTLACQEQIMTTRDNDDHRVLRGVISPVAVIASGGMLLIPVLVGNATMETKDHLDARRIAQHCGGRPKSDERIAGEVAGSAALSVITQGLQIGPAGEAAQNARR